MFLLYIIGLIIKKILVYLSLKTKNKRTICYMDIYMTHVWCNYTCVIHHNRVRYWKQWRDGFWFGPLILLHWVLCFSHRPVQICEMDSPLLPIIYKQKKVLSLLGTPLISLDFVVKRTASCFSDIQPKGPVWQSSHHVWVSLRLPRLSVSLRALHLSCLDSQFFT